MHRRQVRLGLVSIALFAAAFLGLTAYLQAADQPINLDENSANGDESRVSTKVLQTYPVKIENTVYNNAAGEAFNFKWAGAGPGGFNSFVAAGPGVGTIWTWTTVYQVYSIDAPVVFAPARTMTTFGTPTRGVGSTSGDGNFLAPGKSIYPNQVTLSSASLTSSLITFFSPEKTIASCGVDCSTGDCDIFLENNTGETVTLANRQQDCCLEPQQLICEGTCVSYLTDDQNCGGCGNVCAGDEFCSNGACEPICPGETLCGEECADLTSDPLNCGACGNACAGNEYCSAGACQLNCGSLTECGGMCVDLASDPLNCGGCGTVCAGDEFCGSGACQKICGSLTLCGNECVDVTSDPLNCGACATACAADEFCGAGTCQAICGSLTMCGGECVDLTSDPLNCGTCGLTCGTNQICTGGTCQQCRPPKPTACNNVCTNTNTDGQNCGACGNVCDFSSCPSTGQGTCSQGKSCVCSPAATSDTSSQTTVLPTRPTRTVFPERVGLNAQARMGARAKPRLQTAAASTTAPASTVQEAPVCDLQPIEQVVPSGGRYSQTASGGRFNKEIQTTVSIVKDGQVVAQGPCPLVVPVANADTSGVILTAVDVATVDQSGDGLCQPGEARCDFSIQVSNVGDAPCVNPVATLSSPPEQFNPNQITFLNASSAYPNFPGYPGDGQPLENLANTTAFSIAPPADQPADVGRPFMMSVTCSNRPEPVLMPITLGIGAACDPNNITGENYDYLNGFQSPLRVRLTQTGPVNYASGSINHGSTVPMKLALGCGGRMLTRAEINPHPQIVSITHATLGPQPLTGINGDNMANPDDPSFSCTETGCDYQFRTEQLPAGTYVIGVKMPDSRVFRAGFTVNP
jgi:hypothetical protein